jgi:amidophosphoribosyltransferase
MGGLFGAFSQTSAAEQIKQNRESTLEDAYLGLFALQHRGQQSAGMAWLHEGSDRIQSLKTNGLLGGIDISQLDGIKSNSAIGQVRASNREGSSLIQPITIKYSRGYVAVAHDGILSNTEELTKKLEKDGAIFQSDCDTELLLHLMAHRPEKEPLEALLSSLPSLRGGFSMLLLLENKLIALRDSLGFRPLVLGRRENMIYVASETCALDIIGARLIREIEPGEAVVISENDMESVRFAPQIENLSVCSFEYVYTARPDSIMEGKYVYAVRKELGRILARMDMGGSVNANLVTGMPDSGTIAALGYAEASGLPYDIAVSINRYVGRTFIRPTQRIRELGVRLKLNPSVQLLSGKKVVIVDDSIVRGITSRKAVSTIRESGPSEIHLRIASPPVRFPCRYGIDTPSSDMLIASRMDIETLCSHIGADSLAYVKENDLINAIGLPPNNMCTACFSGKYPYDSDG